MRAYYNELRAKGVPHNKARQMVDPFGRRRAAVELLYKWLLVIACMLAVAVIAMRWVEVRAETRIAGLKQQVADLERMLVGCLEFKGFHIDKSYYQCHAQEAKL